MRLLIIGALNDHIGLASQMAQARGVGVNNAPTIEAALGLLRSGKGADLIMVDVSLDVKALVDSLYQERFSIPVVGVGIEANSKDAVRAIKAGAKEYIPLPPDEALIAAVFEAIAEETSEVIYRSKQMSEILTIARQVAPSEANVLITGESGTGKEVLARFIHKNSNRARGPFISLNCAAIPENLLESELFGHERGAFTGALNRRIGKFEEANNGTLLLDEISEMDARLQAKLLRAIQEKEIDRVGGNRPVKINIRVIATSNRDLQEEVKKGNFREDLFFRLNIIHLQIPPLRERKEDILLFADHFIAKYSALNGIEQRPLAESARNLLLSYPWAGNVRELENAMHRAVLLTSGDVLDVNAIMLQTQPINLAASQGGYSSGGNYSSGDIVQNLVGKTVDSVERDLILKTLDHCLGNRTHAANILGISIRTLRNKLKQYEGEQKAG